MSARQKPLALTHRLTMKHIKPILYGTSEYNATLALRNKVMRLPLGLERLDMSHNRLKGELEVKKGSMPTLVELDLSYNRLNGIFIHESNLQRLILAHNNLCWNVVVTGKALRYLDVSYNRLLSPNPDTFPHETDTILWEGTPTGEGKMPPPPPLRS